MTLPTNIPWKLIGIAAGSIALLAAIYFLIIAPRLDLADVKVDQAQTAQVRAETITDTMGVVADAQSEADASRVDAENAVAPARQRFAERDRELRAVIVEQAVEDGDPFMSEGMDAFLKELGRE